MIGFRFTVGCPNCASELETIAEAKPSPAGTGAVLRCTECTRDYHVSVTLQRVPRFRPGRKVHR